MTRSGGNLLRNILTREREDITPAQRVHEVSRKFNPERLLAYARHYRRIRAMEDVEWWAEPGGLGRFEQWRVTARAARQYALHHPGATWEDIFEVIPHHYKNVHSMAVTLRQNCTAADLPFIPLRQRRRA